MSFNILPILDPILASFNAVGQIFIFVCREIMKNRSSHLVALTTSETNGNGPIVKVKYFIEI